MLDLLTEMRLLGAKLADTPIEANHGLNDQDGMSLIDVGRYQRLVRKLIYLALTRPNITFAVSVVSQFMHAPRTSHLEVTFCILRYLKSAPEKGLLFSDNGFVRVEVYTNAD